MKFTTDQPPLADWLKRVASVADERSPAPLFQCVRIDITETKLSLSATNSLFNMRSGYGLLAGEPGSVSTPAGRLASLVGSLRPDAPVTIAYETVGPNNAPHLRVRSGRTNVLLEAIDPIDLPVFASKFPEPQISVTVAEFDAMLAFTAPAMEDTPDRPALWGVGLFYEPPGDVYAAATDGRSGALYHLDASASEFPTIILPRPLCQKLRILLKGQNEEIKIAINPRSVQFLTSDWGLIGKIIDAEPMAYKRWMPGLVDNPVTINTAELGAILNRFEAATDMDNIKLKQHGAVLSFANQTLRLRNAPRTFEDQMAVVYEGEPDELGINSVHFREAISVIGQEEVELHYRNREAPIRVCAPGVSDKAFITTPYSIL